MTRRSCRRRSSRRPASSRPRRTKSRPRPTPPALRRRLDHRVVVAVRPGVHGPPPLHSSSAFCNDISTSFKSSAPFSRMRPSRRVSNRSHADILLDANTIAPTRPNFLLAMLAGVSALRRPSTSSSISRRTALFAALGGAPKAPLLLPGYPRSRVGDDPTRLAPRPSPPQRPSWAALAGIDVRRSALAARRAGRRGLSSSRETTAAVGAAGRWTRWTALDRGGSGSAGRAARLRDRPELADPSERRCLASASGPAERRHDRPARRGAGLGSGMRGLGASGRRRRAGEAARVARRARRSSAPCSSRWPAPRRPAAVPRCEGFSPE